MNEQNLAWTRNQVKNWVIDLAGGINDLPVNFFVPVFL